MDTEESHLDFVFKETHNRKCKNQRPLYMPFLRAHKSRMSSKYIVNVGTKKLIKSSLEYSEKNKNKITVMIEKVD